MMNFREIMEECKKCIIDILHFILIIYSKNLIKTYVRCTNNKRLNTFL